MAIERCYRIAEMRINHNINTNRKTEIKSIQQQHQPKKRERRESSWNIQYMCAVEPMESWVGMLSIGRIEHEQVHFYLLFMFTINKMRQLNFILATRFGFVSILNWDWIFWPSTGWNGLFSRQIVVIVVGPLLAISLLMRVYMFFPREIRQKLIVYLH